MTEWRSCLLSHSHGALGHWISPNAQAIFRTSASPGHPVNCAHFRPSSHPIIWISAHSVIRSSSLLPIQPFGYPVVHTHPIICCTSDHQGILFIKNLIQGRCPRAPTGEAVLRTPACWSVSGTTAGDCRPQTPAASSNKVLTHSSNQIYLFKSWTPTVATSELLEVSRGLWVLHEACSQRPCRKSLF